MIRYFAKSDPPDPPFSYRRLIMLPDSIREEVWQDGSWQEDDADYVTRMLVLGEGDHVEITPELAEKTWPGSTEPDDATLVSKAESERRFTLGPMYIPDRKDAHAEWTDADELQKAVWDYVKKGDRRIRLQHDVDKVAGEFVEIMAWPFEVEAPMVRKDGSSRPMKFPANTVFLGVQWEPWAWEMVKEGKILGYSIGGKAQRLLVDLPDDGSEN